MYQGKGLMIDSECHLKSQPKIVILLCTFNGERFLEELLDSLENQTYTNWEVWAADDESQDKTASILQSYKERWPAGRLSIHIGPRQGFVANFLSAVCRVKTEAEYYAFSDQDDIWEKDKLERAVRWMQGVPNQQLPALYCSRTKLIDSNNQEIGLSPLFPRPPSFANALMQNIGGGNTMVFNRAARILLHEAGDDVPVATHDWWVYMVVAGCGGVVHYDQHPALRYRQHSGNIVGMNSNWLARLNRVRMYWKGCFRRWSDNNIIALRRLEHKLTPENKRTLDAFSQSRELGLVGRLIQLRTSGLYRQTWWGNLGLYAAVVFKKI